MTDDQAPADPSAVRRGTVGDVGLQLPAALQHQPGSPVDGPAAVFTGGGLTVVVDAGPFADRLDSRVGEPSFAEHTDASRGLTERRVTYRDPRTHAYTAAVHLGPARPVTVTVTADDGVPEDVVTGVLDVLALGPATPRRTP